MIRTRAAIEADIQADIRDKLGNAAGGISAGDHADAHSDILASAAHLTETELRVESMTLTAPPGSPADRAAYVVGAGATGAWSGQAGKLAIWDDAASAWAFFAGVEGQAVWDRATDAQYRYLSAVWVEQEGGAASGSDSGISLDQLTDVDLTGAGEGDILYNDTGAGQWQARAARIGQPLYVAVQVFGLPDAGEEVAVYKAAVASSHNADWAGAQGLCRTNPTATAVFTIKKNGSQIGTVSISTGGSFTFATSGGAAQSLAIGDVLSVEAPDPADATLAGVHFTLTGVISG